jgi:hypothetical protein
MRCDALSRFSRRAFLGGLLVLPVLAGCGSPVLRDAAIQPASAVGMPAQVPAPALRAGDRWAYTQRDALTGLVSNQAQIRIAAVTGEGYRVVEEWQKGGTVSALYDPELNPMRTYNLSFQPAFPRFSFPLAVGKSWQGSVLKRDVPAQRYGNVREWVRATVRGWERVTVPAGTFTALRIDIAVDWSDLDAAGLRGTSRETVWYVPEVRGAALSHRQDFYGDVQLINDSVLELTAFGAGN